MKLKIWKEDLKCIRRLKVGVWTCCNSCVHRAYWGDTQQIAYYLWVSVCGRCQGRGELHFDVPYYIPDHLGLKQTRLSTKDNHISLSVNGLHVSVGWRVQTRNGSDFCGHFII